MTRRRSAALLLATLALAGTARPPNALASPGASTPGPGSASSPAARPARAIVPPTAAERTALSAYLDALKGERYDVAFQLLVDAQRGYFLTAANFASIFRADRFKLTSYKLVGTTNRRPAGALAVVAEHIRFFDHARQADAQAEVTTKYGLALERGKIRIGDPFHPWKAFAPGTPSAKDSLEVIVRKVSLFANRIEVIVTFTNTGDGSVTLLPYRRTALRDERGTSYPIVETALPALTDRQLRLGLRLAASARYTGALTFSVPDKTPPPHSLMLTIAPSLRDGSDEPFELALPAITVPQ